MKHKCKRCHQMFDCYTDDCGYQYLTRYHHLFDQQSNTGVSISCEVMEGLQEK